MTEFNLYKDTKYTNWYRQYYTVEAETLEEAINLIITNQVECYADEDLNCFESISPKENSDYPTVEIYTEGDNTILWDNVYEHGISSNKE